jgi:hypothetical protein
VRRPLWWWLLLAAAALLLVVAGYVYWAGRPVTPAPVSPPAPAEAPRAEAPPEPVIEHPVQPAPPAPVALDASDAPMAAALGSLIGADRLAQWFATDALVRRFVATIDNLSRATVAPRVRVIRPVAGSFMVDHAGDELLVAPGNAARYAPYVQAIERVDAKQLAGVYLRFYPWFQQAYEELGYPKAYFNDRLVASIDHLLATPEPAGPLKLVQTKVLYEYADPQLEALSAGQKAMLRMGVDNMRRVKAKLRTLRSEIARK